MMNISAPEIANPLKNGRIIKTDCPIAEYLASRGEDGKPILSRGDLCEIAVNPRRWHNGYRRPDDRTPSKEFGSLLDCLITQPHRLEEYYRMAPATYQTKKGETKDWTWKSLTCREWRDQIEASGQLVMCKDDLTAAQKAVETLLSNQEQGKRTRRLLDHAKTQVFGMAEYHDSETGLVVTVRTLTDVVPSLNDPDFGKCLFDIKTCASAGPRQWRNAVIDHDYHTQGAMGLDVYTAATGEDRCDFRHIIIENVAPFDASFRFLASDLLNEGRRKYLAALKIFCNGIATGYWPGYNDPAATILPDGYESCNLEAWMIR